MDANKLHLTIRKKGTLSPILNNRIVEIKKNYVGEYEGEYVVTPTAHSITLNTKDLVMLDNVTIKPIPNDYGKIAFDGASLTII